MTDQPRDRGSGVPADSHPEWDFAGAVEDLFDGLVPAIGSEPADCCAGPPAFRVVLPATVQRQGRAELLFCAHHFRSAQQGLARAHADVFDAAGRPVAPGCLPASR